MEKTKDSRGGFGFKMLALQAIFCIIVLLTVIITKFLFKSTFNSLKKLYKNNLTQTTSVSEVLEENDEN